MSSGFEDCLDIAQGKILARENARRALEQVAALKAEVDALREELSELRFNLNM